ncbi:MAG: hypothetical protein H7282_04950 [Cytophagaceae bacterium]|nr:hypothetical protein [Cytophagaceae bacterium]
MPFYTRSQFADLCGIEKKNARAYISTNIKRGRIVLSGELIDDELEVNKDFLARALVNAEKREQPQQEESTNESAPGPKVSKPIYPDQPGKNLQKPNTTGNMSIEKALKQQEFEKKQVETRILNIKEQKLIGEVIPTDLVKMLFTQHSQSITTEFNNSISDLVTLFAKRNGMNTNELAEMRGQIVVIINTAVDKAVNLSKKNINNIINEFAVKRDVGERE